MIQINRIDFLIQCVKANKSLNDALPCIIKMENDTWTADDKHPCYPQVNFNTSSNEQIILCGSLAGLDKIQTEFMSQQAK